MSETLEKCQHEGLHWFPRITVEKYSIDQTAWAETKLAEALSWGRKIVVPETGQPTSKLHGSWLRELFPEPEDGYAYDEGNQLVNNGLTTIAYLLFGATASGGFGQGLMTGGSGANLVTSATQHAGVGAGSSSTAFAATQTTLQGDGSTTTAYYEVMDSGFPSWQGSGTPGQLNGQATFASANGNFAWNEWCWFTSTTAVGSWTPGGTLASVGTNTNMWNRKVTSLGTKASGASWVFTQTITFS